MCRRKPDRRGGFGARHRSCGSGHGQGYVQSDTERQARSRSIGRRLGESTRHCRAERLGVIRMLAIPDTYPTDLAPLKSDLKMPYTLTPGRAAGTFLAEIGNK